MAKRRTDWESWVSTALKGRHLREPSEPVVHRAVGLGRRLRPEKPAGLNWLVELLFDSAAQPLPAGVRGAVGAERRFLYGAKAAEETCQVDLRLIRGSGGGIAITGQVMPPPSGGRVEASIGKTARRSRLGETGEFVFRRLPGRGRTMRLEIRGEDRRPLIIDDVPLPESTGDDE